MKKKDKLSSLEIIQENIELLTPEEKQVIRQLLFDNESVQTESDLSNIREVIKQGLIGIPLEVDGVPYKIIPTTHNYIYPITKI
jgi:hypothetical protein